MLDGSQWRKSQQWDMAAWVTANLINVSGKTVKKATTPDKLLGRKPKRVQRPVDRVLDFEEIIRRQHALDGGSE